MIGRIHGRNSFTSLYREGRRSRAGALTVLYRPAPTGRPCVAFSITRRVGPAVSRNLCRRRLRSAFEALAREEQPPPAGEYLILVANADWDYHEGRAWLKQAVAKMSS